MRFIALGLAAPIMLAVSGCGGFGGNSSESETKATATEVTEQSTEATPSNVAENAAPATTDGKPTAPVEMAANGAPTDRKPTAANASNRCTDNNDRRVVVVNDTRTTMRELYGSNVTRTTWEEDVLGTRVLPAGERINVNWDDGSCECNFDMKAVFMDGTETVRRGFNVCREAQWRIVE